MSIADNYVESYTKKVYVPLGIAVLLVMFNVYFINVMTGYDRRPEYCYMNCNPVNENLRDSLDYYRHLGLLIIGILNLVMAMLVNISYVSTALGISGLITLIYATGGYWNKYDDKMRLVIVTLGLGLVIYMAYRVFGK